MTTSADNTSYDSAAEVPVIVPLPSLPADPIRLPVPGPAPAPAPAPVLPAPSGPCDLAAEALRRRAERHSRETSIEASWQLAIRVKHPDGGDCTVEEILLQEEVQRRAIERATEAGSRAHRRLPRWMRSIPKWVLGFDFGLLLYFFSGITNVDWNSPLSLPLAFAVALAAMVTLLSYGFLAFTGHRMRSHKNPAGTIFHEEVDRVTVAAFAISVVVIAVLAILMFTRIWTEVLNALGSQAQVTALVIAGAVGVVDAAANLLVICVHALDGSDQTARLDKLSAAIRKPLRRAHELGKQAAKQLNG